MKFHNRQKEVDSSKRQFIERAALSAMAATPAFRLMFGLTGSNREQVLAAEVGAKPLFGPLVPSPLVKPAEILYDKIIPEFPKPTVLLPDAPCFQPNFVPRYFVETVAKTIDLSYVVDFSTGFRYLKDQPFWKRYAGFIVLDPHRNIGGLRVKKSRIEVNGQPVIVDGKEMMGTRKTDFIAGNDYIFLTVSPEQRTRDFFANLKFTVSVVGELVNYYPVLNTRRIPVKDFPKAPYFGKSFGIEPGAQMPFELSNRLTEAFKLKNSPGGEARYHQPNLPVLFKDKGLLREDGELPSHSMVRILGNLKAATVYDANNFNVTATEILQLKKTECTGLSSVAVTACGYAGVPAWGVKGIVPEQKSGHADAVIVPADLPYPFIVDLTCLGDRRRPDDILDTMKEGANRLFIPVLQGINHGYEGPFGPTRSSSYNHIVGYSSLSLVDPDCEIGHGVYAGTVDFNKKTVLCKVG